MKHPNKEQWMDFLYGEADPSAAQEYRAHLENCAECQRQVGAWRGTMRTLDAWQLPSRERISHASPGRWRWAAAAAIVLAAGFSIGAAARRPNVAAIEKSITPAIQAAVERDLREKFTLEWRAEIEAGLREQMVAGLRELEARRVNDLVEFRRDLERVAVATDASLQVTQSRLAQLVSYPQTSPGR